MKYTAEGLRDTLLSMIEEMGNHPEQYAENPGKDFTRRRSLTLPVLMKLILRTKKASGRDCSDILGMRSTLRRQAPLSSNGKSCCLVHFLSCSTVSPMLWMRQRDFGVIGCWPWTALP